MDGGNDNVDDVENDDEDEELDGTSPPMTSSRARTREEEYDDEELDDLEYDSSSSSPRRWRHPSTSPTRLIDDRDEIDSSPPMNRVLDVVPATSDAANAVDSLAPSFLALPPPRAPPADDLIGDDDDDEHDVGAAAEEEKLDDDDGFLVMLREEASFLEDAPVVRCFSWDRFRLMTPPPPAAIVCYALVFLFAYFICLPVVPLHLLTSDYRALLYNVIDDIMARHHRRGRPSSIIAGRRQIIYWVWRAVDRCGSSISAMRMPPNQSQ